MKNSPNESHNVLNIRGIIDDGKCFRTVRELTLAGGHTLYTLSVSQSSQTWA